ncbi:hypothetical protein AURANDRAFT_69507, partial [Aureococcus anophagefferens]
CWLVAAREANGAKPASSFAVTPGATGARTDDVAKPAAAVALDPKTGLPAPLAKKRAAKPAAAAPARPAPPPFPAAACRDVLEQLLAARAAEMDRRAAPAGRSVAVVPGTAGAVRWANANDKVHVSAQLAEGTKRGHVRVDISATRLAVKVGALVGGDFKLATLLDGALFQDVDPAASSWTLVDTDLGSAELQVTLAKKPYSRTAAALDALSIKEDPGSTRADPSIEACKVRSHMSTGDPYVADDVAGSYLQMTCARSNFRAVGWRAHDFRKPI